MKNYGEPFLFDQQVLTSKAIIMTNRPSLYHPNLKMIKHYPWCALMAHCQERGFSNDK